MAIPSDLLSNALAALTAARTEILSASFQASLNDPGQRLAVSNELIDLQQAILNLSNAALSDIVAQMQQQGQALVQATSGLNAALEDITKVQNVIAAVSNIVSVVSKIVPFI